MGARQWVNIFVSFLIKDDPSLFSMQRTQRTKDLSPFTILNENWPLPKLCIYQLPTTVCHHSLLTHCHHRARSANSYSTRHRKDSTEAATSVPGITELIIQRTLLVILTLTRVALTHLTLGDLLFMKRSEYGKKIYIYIMDYKTSFLPFSPQTLQQCLTHMNTYSMYIYGVY